MLRRSRYGQERKKESRGRRPCDKKRYKDKDMAISAIHIIGSRGEERKGGIKPIRYYWCKFCVCFHITSQDNLYGDDREPD